MIRVDAGMSTTRFCRLIDMPERTWRRWQARAAAGEQVCGPWPAPVAATVQDAVVGHAQAHPAWGHRKVWAMTRYDGHRVSPATVLRIMRGRGLLLAADYQAERRQLAALRRAVFVTPPDRPNQVWQLDFSEFETTRGGMWRIAACTDYWSKYELGWHLALTANQHDAVAAVEAAIGEAERLAGRPLLEQITDSTTGEIRPVTIVTDIQRRAVPLRPLRRLHRRPTRTGARPDPSEDSRPERGPRTWLRIAQVRTAVPRTHPRRPRPGRARRGLPGRIQHRPTP